MLNILTDLRACWKNKQPAALATIIAVDGSAYRKEGARCLIHKDGSITGIVSGGCVEGDLIEHAQNVIGAGICKQVKYDFRQGDDVPWGLGLGCNGAITLLIQPFDPVNQPDIAENLLTYFERYVSSQSSYFIVTILASENEGKVAVGKMV
ncbi:MAG TPA: XdhC family protein, partial [Neobacillus sp.]